MMHVGYIPSAHLVVTFLHVLSDMFCKLKSKLNAMAQGLMFCFSHCDLQHVYAKRPRWLLSFMDPSLNFSSSFSKLGLLVFLSFFLLLFQPPTVSLFFLCLAFSDSLCFKSSLITHDNPDKMTVCHLTIPRFQTLLT